MWLNKALLQTIGFDFERGGLYETGHNPVEGGTPDDTRLVIKNRQSAEFHGVDEIRRCMRAGTAFTPRTCRAKPGATSRSGRIWVRPCMKARHC